MSCAEVISVVKDIVLSGAAITGAVVAVKGLGTWQRQLKGQSEYELSRRILVTVFKYRDAIDGVRRSDMWPYEMPSPSEDEAKTMDCEQKRFHGISKAYQARWDKVQIEKTSLYADLLEAEAIWGNELKNIFKRIFDLEHELFTRIRHYIELINPDTKESSKEALRRIDSKNRDIMYHDLDEEPDEFKKELILAIEDVEKILKPNLRQEKV
ncbi:MAG: hypothetical protein GY820_08575 [Gammaproteobacteria bacterium]|nr:hypothetical protein [Gammaproteobacteria bacterium]